MADTDGLEDAAILMMSLGEEEASEVFKHLSPKEVQKLGEAIARPSLVSGWTMWCSSSRVWPQRTA